MSENQIPGNDLAIHLTAIALHWSAAESGGKVTGLNHESCRIGGFHTRNSTSLRAISEFTRQKSWTLNWATRDTWPKWRIIWVLRGLLDQANGLSHHQTPGNWGLRGQQSYGPRLSRNRVVEHAVWSELVSAGFPCLTGTIQGISSNLTNLGSIQRSYAFDITALIVQIPYLTQQGIILDKQ
jgi:hypothetical protein